MHLQASIGHSYVRTPSVKKPIGLLDAEPFFSPCHPKGDALKTLLEACRKSSVLHHAKRSASVPAGGSGVARGARDRTPRLYDLVREHGFTNVTALQAHACKEAENGRPALAEFCTKHGQKLQAYLSAAQSVAAAPQKLLLMGETLMDKLRRAAVEGKCACRGEWQPGAEKILGLNDIPVSKFCV